MAAVKKALENDIYRLRADGLSVRDIAISLGVKVSCVNAYLGDVNEDEVSELKRKLNLIMKNRECMKEE